MSGRLRHTEINDIGAYNTTDKYIHARGAPGLLHYRRLAGVASASTDIACSGITPRDEIVFAFLLPAASATTGVNSRTNDITSTITIRANNVLRSSHDLSAADLTFIVCWRSDPAES